MKFTKFTTSLGVITCGLLLIAAFVISQHVEDKLEDESQVGVADVSHPEDAETIELQKLKGKTLIEKLNRSAVLCTVKMPFILGWTGHCYECCLSKGYWKYVSLPFVCYCQGDRDEEQIERYKFTREQYRMNRRRLAEEQKLRRIRQREEAKKMVASEKVKI